MNPDKAIVLTSYSLLSSAESAAACLRANGIERLVQADDCGGMLAPLALEEGVSDWWWMPVRKPKPGKSWREWRHPCRLEGANGEFGEKV